MSNAPALTDPARTEAPLRMEDAGPIRILTLADPARRNALSLAAIAQLHAALRQAAAEAPAIRAVILAAEGPAFSAGHDLKEIQAARAAPDRGKAFFETLMAACAEMMLEIVHMPVPVIAAIEGIATAAGCQLVASCDLAIAGDRARFATPGVNIGLFCSTPMVALARNVASKHAMEMLLTGEMIDAEAAHRFGLVNRVVPAGEALDAALALARRIAEKPAATLRIGKEAFYRQREMPLADAYEYARRVMVENMLMREAEAGIAAFVARPKR
ncbi:MAG: enoyl-CoA hydratase [Hyphomicrobiales bacterium]|uniref:enoyl-CoA hydratase n=1 Tax=Rhabdaerophilum calidifontis TaxID=2604328 RepID=UPI001FE73ABE|nr:enoyl-CoA hydratase [Rhabdaerophilum calidifontis]MCA1953369.1 enoyl-CoA hydratase [Hyphomicrobiales bacterium]